MNTSRPHLEILHELMDADPIDTSDTAAPEAALPSSEVADHELDDLSEALPDETINEALTQTDLNVLSAEAQSLLLAITNDAAAMEPETRRRLVKAAERGIRYRRDDRSALPRLLFLRRRDARRELQEVAEHIGVEPATLQAVEQGQRVVETLKPAQVATWIRTLGVDPDHSRDSLRRALARQAGQHRAAASAQTPTDPKGEEFIKQVMQHLESGQR